MTFKNGVSTNFWFSVVALITIVLNQLGINIDESQLTTVVEAIATKQITAIIVSVVGAVMMLYNAFKSQKITGTFADVYKYRNFWTAVIVLLAGIFSAVRFGDFPVEEAESLADAIFSGNITLIIAGAWAFVQAIWFIIKDNTGKDTGEQAKATS